MFICGKDGEEMRCCKTGLKIKDVRYVEGTLHSADMYYCPKCHGLVINRASSEFSSTAVADLTMGDGHAVWDLNFKARIAETYGVELLNT